MEGREITTHTQTLLGLESTTAGDCFDVRCNKSGLAAFTVSELNYKVVLVKTSMSEWAKCSCLCEFCPPLFATYD